MKNITSHQVNGCNREIRVAAMDEVGPGGAHRRYQIKGPSIQYLGVGLIPSFCTDIRFQEGDPKVRVNGCTNEALLAVLIHRMEGFQSGQFACKENQEVLELLQKAQKTLHSRTQDREARGVEGTQEV